METTSSSNEAKAPRVIKRYANRKLYDTRDSRYVTLQQIAEFVRGGEDVAIIDNTTKEDLTSATLAQIVYEAEKAGAEGGRPKTMGTLRELIQNGGERLMTTLREGPMGKLIARREGDSGEKPEAPKPEVEELKGERKNLLLHPKEAIDELQRLADERVRAALGTAIQSVHQLQNEVKRLQGRIEELERNLIALQQRRNQPDGSDTTRRENGQDVENRS
ncbi:MAG: polyhydroxyalkanoate synthesis regulator DNA-binding domain-containing protein [Sandaracinaceae bacterium]